MKEKAVQENLKRLIAASGKNAKDVALEMGLTPATLSRYALGRMPDMNCILKIADYFKVSIDWLVGYIDDRYSSITPELHELVDLYSTANIADRKAIMMILSKYKKGEADG